MNEVNEYVAEAIKASRETKGYSQRDLSAISGVPQPHISKIESGAVDLRISSLASIGHALGLDLMLVPQRVKPAVRSIIQTAEASPVANSKAAKELSKLQSLVRTFERERTDLSHLERLQRSIRELSGYSNLIGDTSIVTNVRRLLEEAKPKQLESSIQKALTDLLKLQKRLATGSANPHQSRLPQPAYSLDDDDAD